MGILRLRLWSRTRASGSGQAATASGVRLVASATTPRGTRTARPPAARQWSPSNDPLFAPQREAVAGGVNDSYRYNPWRAPGYAPVNDACGMAGGAPKAGPGEGHFFPVPWAKQGDLGSRVLPRTAPGTVWMAGDVVEVGWGIRYNHGGGYQYRLCPAGEPLTEECFARHPLPFYGYGDHPPPLPAGDSLDGRLGVDQRDAGGGAAARRRRRTLSATRGPEPHPAHPLRQYVLRPAGVERLQDPRHRRQVQTVRPAVPGGHGVEAGQRDARQPGGRRGQCRATPRAPPSSTASRSPRAARRLVPYKLALGLRGRPRRSGPAARTSSSMRHHRRPRRASD